MHLARKKKWGKMLEAKQTWSLRGLGVHSPNTLGFLPLLHSRGLTVGFHIFIYGSMYIFCFPGWLKCDSFILF